jgi:hypothetical protein
MGDEEDLDLYHEAEIKGNPMAKIEVLNRAREKYINKMKTNHPMDRYTHQINLNDENSLLTNYIDGEKSKIYNRMGARDANSTSSSSEIVRGPNTPRSNSPTRQSNKDAAEAKDAEEVEKNRWYLGKHLVSAYRSLTPSSRAKSSSASTAVTKGRTLARKSNHTIVGRKFKPDKEGGSKKTRKSKKSSRRNRK